MPEETDRGDAPSEAAKLQVHRVELLLSHMLRGGVIASTAIILVGVVLTFAHHPGYFSNAQSVDELFKQMAFPHSIDAVLEGLRQGEGRAVIVLGLFVLIATPVARVAASVVIFLHLRDRLFVVFTTIVLVLLIVSFFLGRAGE